ncbi:uncharacterized protein LOC143298350 [Babylonia areolata]|uniref:uncharacterized protein LOC143298350 n=1 Tax=Babylonia areolata TaxID=304850 RepID=UPI003FD0F324
MAMDVVQSGGPDRPPVNRCLFGRPSAQEQAAFTARLTRREHEAAQRFSRRWNFDVFSDREKEEGGRYQWVKVKSASDSDLPEFYSRGFAHHARRKAMTPNAGKSLTLGEEEGDGGGAEGGVLCSPVRFTESTSVEAFLGLPPHHHHHHHHPLPLRSAASADPLVSEGEEAWGQSPRLSVIPSSLDDPAATPSSSSPSSLSRRCSDSTLSEVWRSRKRWRSQTPHREEPDKRERQDCL